MIPQVTLPFLLVLSPALHPDSEAALERRLRKAVLRHEPVTLGTAAAPYEPQSASALGVLLKEEGLEVSITTATPRIQREIDLLVDLDRRHSVTVRMIVPAEEDPASRMQVVRTLAAEGIATILLLPIADRELLEQAWEAGAWDVELDVSSAKRSEKAPLLEDFRWLRLEHGFPRGVPGRG